MVWDRILDKGKDMGIITCPSYSKLTNCSMAIAHTITFNDSEKKKRTAQD